jgi:hypothetical protein
MIQEIGDEAQVEYVEEKGLFRIEQANVGVWLSWEEMMDLWLWLEDNFKDS